MTVTVILKYFHYCLLSSEYTSKKLCVLFHAVDHLVNNAGVSGIPILIEDIHDLTKYNPIMVSYMFSLSIKKKNRVQ